MNTWSNGTKTKQINKRKQKLKLASVSAIILSLSISSLGASKKPITLPEPAKKEECCNIECLRDKFYGELRVRGLFLIEKNIKFEFISDSQKWPCDSTPTAIACQLGEKIQFRKSHWDSIQCDQRENLAFHEISHVHGLPHKEGTIMQSRLLGSVKYLANRSQLIDDLAKQLGAP